jgi:hypothetical protein
VDNDVELEPDHGRARWWLGFVLVSLGRTDEALLGLQHAREVIPGRSAGQEKGEAGAHAYLASKKRGQKG